MELEAKLSLAGVSALVSDTAALHLANNAVGKSTRHRNRVDAFREAVCNQTLNKSQFPTV